METIKLETIIESVKKDNGTKLNTSIKRLRLILKAFNDYSTTAEKLPPPTLIPICLFSVPKLFKKLLSLEEGEYLEEIPQSSGLKLCLQSYFKGLLRLLGECDEEIKHVVVQSMSQCIELIVVFPNLCKKWLRALVVVWVTCNDNLNLALRCFICFQKAMLSGDGELYLWSLRRVYVGYFEHCGQVSWRTLEHITFMGNCFCELANINPQKAYYVMFGYVRSLAMQMQGLNNAKGKEKRELISKLYSQQTLQVLRLLGQVVGKGGEDLSALAYPFAELLNSFEKVSESPEYLPLKLHIIQVELQLMENTGLYLPHVLETALKILGSSPLHKKHAKKAGVEGSIELGYKLSHQELKNTQILNDIFDKTLFYLHWLSVLAEKMVGGVEIVRQICKLIHSVEVGFSGHKRAIKAFTRILNEDVVHLDDLRRKRKLSLHDKALEKFQRYLNSDKIALKGKDKYLELQEERQTLFRAKVVAEQEQQPEQSEEERIGDHDDELQDGWEEASEGASDFEEQQNSQEEDDSEEEEQQEMEDISYSGDPEDPDEAVKEWSEHEWSSQEEEANDD